MTEMSDEQTQVPLSGDGAESVMSAGLERLRARADNAYISYIGCLRRDECLGWEIKVARSEFGEAEMKAHCAAAEMLGRHKALHEAANMMDDLLRSNAKLTGAEPNGGASSERSERG
jgi:hypothetical protein